MRPQLQHDIKEITWITISWIIIMYWIFLNGWWQTEDLLDRDRLGVVIDYINSGYVHFEIFGVGLLFGLMFALINVYADKHFFKQMPFGQIILLKTIFYGISLVLGWFIVVSILVFMGILGDQQMEAVKEILNIKFISVAVANLTFYILLISFIIQLNKRFGQGVLLDFLTGKYYKPVEEERIFMFLDLKSSTTYAEKLGHIKYSRFLQDCFRDLNNVLIEYKAEIYQYVGDEAVLTWTIPNGMEDQNCIKLYFAFMEVLKNKTDYYLEKYGIEPQFKAGVNSGKVMVAEVGDIKSEIAYHGDVLNTAARIQGQCNKYNSQLLISENIQNLLKSATSSKLLGNISLKGKQETVNIFSIEI